MIFLFCIEGGVVVSVTLAVLKAYSLFSAQGDIWVPHLVPGIETRLNSNQGWLYAKQASCIMYSISWIIFKIIMIMVWFMIHFFK